VIQLVQNAITHRITAFNTWFWITDGFTVGTTMALMENTYVAWQWKANGGTTASNTDG
jgi:hypothetical protein